MEGQAEPVQRQEQKVHEDPEEGQMGRLASQNAKAKILKCKAIC